MRRLFFAAAAFGALAGFAGSAQAVELLPPAYFNPQVRHLGPVEANIYNATDVLPQGRPWFPSLGPSYGTFTDPWFPPVGTVTVRPVKAPISK
ncbi:hypothetical protein [Ancylobacter amanitiformis]|uniref:Uncharacterized protein n=1 Tax=Ancylobacter amanitiformis TaxID=217069 RepID=A0ABU0LQ17_9HYPH|nr:hypothetical protein [Ancylobacter amanitiformis]MDQ0510753.1 hypothetical protein [Ancylobacter amanitiformis]